MSETAYNVVNRQTDEVVGTAYLSEDMRLVRFEPTPELHRIVWWQSLIEGMADGETLEEHVPPSKVAERVTYYRGTFARAVGVMVGACPMSFVPGRDKTKGRSAEPEETEP